MATPTTTIRVDRETHAKLLKLSRESGTPLIDTVRAAAEALQLKTVAERVRAELEAMSAEDLASYRAEIDGFPTGDGIGD